MAEVHIADRDPEDFAPAKSDLDGLNENILLSHEITSWEYFLISELL